MGAPCLNSWLTQLVFNNGLFLPLNSESVWLCSNKCPEQCANHTAIRACRTGLSVHGLEKGWPSFATSLRLSLLPEESRMKSPGAAPFWPSIHTGSQAGPWRWGMTRAQDPSLLSTDAATPAAWASHTGPGLPLPVPRGAGLFSLLGTFLNFSNK